MGSPIDLGNFVSQGYANFRIKHLGQVKVNSYQCILLQNQKCHGLCLTAMHFMMVYLIGPDGLVNRRFANFHKMVWMTMVHVLMFRIKHQTSSEIITVLVTMVHLPRLDIQQPKFQEIGFFQYWLPPAERQWQISLARMANMLLNPNLPQFTV